MTHAPFKAGMFACMGLAAVSLVMAWQSMAGDAEPQAPLTPGERPASVAAPFSVFGAGRDEGGDGGAGATGGSMAARPDALLQDDAGALSSSASGSPPAQASTPQGTTTLRYVPPARVSPEELVSQPDGAC